MQEQKSHQIKIPTCGVEADLHPKVLVINFDNNGTTANTMTNEDTKKDIKVGNINIMNTSEDEQSWVQQKQDGNIMKITNEYEECK